MKFRTRLAAPVLACGALLATTGPAMAATGSDSAVNGASTTRVAAVAATDQLRPRWPCPIYFDHSVLPGPCTWPPRPWPRPWPWPDVPGPDPIEGPIIVLPQGR